MSLDPIICKACSFGPCKLGDIALMCGNPDRPAGVDTVQDMVNHLATQSLLDAESKAE